MENSTYNGESAMINNLTRNIIMKKTNWLKSRTIWTVVLLFLLGGLGNIEGFMSNDIYTLLSGVLTVLVIYFRSHPKVDKQVDNIL